MNEIQTNALLIVLFVLYCFAAYLILNAMLRGRRK